MPWFWGGNASRDDPTKSLDPDLKKFLDEQQPKPYVPAQLPTEKPTEKNATDLPSFPIPDTNKSDEDRPLPRESLFQDGRYKHLWKTYVPQSEILAVTENPIDRVVSARKDRRNAIHRAALENCAFEQELQQQCLGSGLKSKVKSRMTMCHEETKTYNRCYQLQAKFMQALGYTSDLRSTDEEEEKIQMHADKLYHKMMDYEAEIEDAKRNNRPIPPLTSLFHPDRPVPSAEDIVLPEKVTSKLKTPLSEMPPHERELAAKVALQEVRFGNTQAEDFFAATTTLNEDRKKRQAWMVKTFGEPIGKFFIPDAPEGPPPADVTVQSPEELEKKIWRGKG